MVVLIKMKDGDEIRIEDASRFHTNHESMHWVVDVPDSGKDTNHIYFNKDYVQYIGEEGLITRKATE